MLQICDGKLKFNINKKIISILLILTGFILSVLVTRKLFYDPDGYWHIKTGEWIYQHKQFPTHDIFSWYGMEHNLTWLNHEWLFDLLDYLVYKLGGLNLVMWSVAFFGGILFLLITWFSYIRSKHLSISLLISLVSILGLQPYLQPRPQIISFILLVSLCILLEKKKWYWVLPIVVIGTNMHGGFYPMYLVLITYYSYKEKPILILLSALAVLINPYGYDMYLYTIRNQGSDIGGKYIMEAYKTAMADKENKIILASYFLLILATHNIKVKWQDALIVFSVAGLTFMAQRHVVFAYLLIMPILSPYVWEKGEKVAQKLSDLSSRRISSSYVYYGIVEVMFIIFIAYGFANLKNVTANNLTPEAMYPTKAVTFIEEHNINRIYNDYNIGGYLLFKDIPTLTDGRADPFSEKFNNTTILRDCMEATKLASDYTKLLKDNNIKHLLIYKKGTMYNAVKNNPRFTEIYKDEYFVIYEFNN